MPLTHHLPAGLAGNCFFASAFEMHCRLVEAIPQADSGLGVFTPKNITTVTLNVIPVTYDSMFS